MWITSWSWIEVRIVLIMSARSFLFVFNNLKVPRFFYNQDYTDYLMNCNTVNIRQSFSLISMHAFLLNRLHVSPSKPQINMLRYVCIFLTRILGATYDQICVWLKHLFLLCITIRYVFAINEYFYIKIVFKLPVHTLFLIDLT